MDVTSQSLVNNGIELSYSIDHTTEANQTMQQMQQRQQALADQVQVVNQAAINAGHISIT